MTGGTRSPRHASHFVGRYASHPLHPGPAGGDPALRRLRRPDGGPPADGGSPDAALPEGAPLRERFERGRLDGSELPRVAYAGLRERTAGDRTAILGIARDTAARERRRLVVRDHSPEAGERERFTLEEAEGERLTDVALHASGEITLGVELLGEAQDAFELRRIAVDGTLRARHRLERPAVPEGDADPQFPKARLAMKGVGPRSVVRGWLPWLRVEARGEGVVLGVLSQAELSPGTPPTDNTLMAAIMTLDWDGAAFRPRWSRIVDGVHQAPAVAWLYDDFHWLDAYTRLLVAQDGGGGDGIVVGRSLADSRCGALVRLGELTAERCRQLRQNSSHRYQPFAWTRFDGSGARLGTTTFAPGGFEDLVIFDLAARGGEVALAGTAVRLGAGGAPDYYFEPPGATDTTPLSPYDGYLALLDATSGAPRLERFIDRGRGDLLSALLWTDEGLLGAGATDWNRWYGGMSLSRSADPLLVLLPWEPGGAGDAAALLRSLPTRAATKDRHSHLLSVATTPRGVIAVGPGDAPMTHSAEFDTTQAALGSIEVTLR